MRLAFKHGFVLAGVMNGLLTLTRGAFPGGRFAAEPDAAQPRGPGDGKRLRARWPPDLQQARRGVQVRERDPRYHSLSPPGRRRGQPRAGTVLRHMCPAGVYEPTAQGLRVNPPNCVDCKATDVLGPRWLPREGGSGPRYRLM